MRSAMTKLVSAAAMTLALSTTGCWSTTIKNGQPPAAEAPSTLNDTWHSGAVFGTIEISGPYDLHALCPNGWAEIKTKTSLWNGLLILFTFDTYSTQTVTVRCAKGGATTAAK